MSYRPTVSIGGVALPEPAEYNALTSTLVDSERNVLGVVTAAVVREDVAKIDMKWSFLEADEWAQVLQMFDSKHGGSFYRDVTFLNQVTNSWTTRTMYVSDRTAGLFLRDPDTGRRMGYRGCKLSLIEK